MNLQVPSVDINVAVASAIERGIISQSELLSSLSVAVIGGLVALRLQLLLHNASRPKGVFAILRVRWYIAVVALATLTILIGFLISGRLLVISPALYNLQFEGVSTFSDDLLKEKSWPTLLQLSKAQVGSFLASAVLGATVILKSTIKLRDTDVRQRNPNVGGNNE